MRGARADVRCQVVIGTAESLEIKLVREGKVRAARTARKSGRFAVGDDLPAGRYRVKVKEVAPGGSRVRWGAGWVQVGEPHAPGIILGDGG